MDVKLFEMLQDAQTVINCQADIIRFYRCLLEEQGIGEPKEISVLQMELMAAVAKANRSLDTLLKEAEKCKK